MRVQSINQQNCNLSYKARFKQNIVTRDLFEYADNKAINNFVKSCEELKLLTNDKNVYKLQKTNKGSGLGINTHIKLIKYPENSEKDAIVVEKYFFDLFDHRYSETPTLESITKTLNNIIKSGK